VHTSTKARLTGVRDPARQENLTIYSLAHFQPSLKILCKSVRQFLRKVANTQTDRQTDKQRRLRVLLGGDNSTA